MELANWRDVALVFLILQAFVFGLIPGIVLYALWYGLRRATAWLRGVGAPQVHHYSHLVASETQRYSALLLTPVVEADAAVTQFRSTLRSAPRVLRRRPSPFRSRQHHV